jgi:threonine/homoserine/homoserine lactone efflux protein
MSHDLWAFALTSLLLNLTPGNDMIYVASRSAGQGVRAGIVSAMGILVGCLVHLLAAVAGISALIAGSATAFQLIKYVGAAYLVYLGTRSLLNKKGNSFQLAPGNAHSSQAGPGTTVPVPLKKIFWQGVLANVLNPKVAFTSNK